MKKGDKIKFNKTSLLSIKDFYLASLINIDKTYKIKEIEKMDNISVFEVEDDDGNLIHCPVDGYNHFFNKKTRYGLFRRVR